jgi:UDP-N-acetylmuramoylalanine-D-glutamate ligase
MKHIAKKPAAIVLGLNGNGLGVARSLGRRNVYVIGVDENMGHPHKCAMRLFLSPLIIIKLIYC